MLTTGNQLRAARALAGMDQGALAERAGVNINTISSMEKKAAEMLTSGLDKVRAVMAVLEGEGIEFLNHGAPGVRLRKGGEDRKNLDQHIEHIERDVAHLKPAASGEPSPATGMAMLRKARAKNELTKAKNKRTEGEPK